MLKYDKADLAEMEILFAGYQREFAIRKLQAAKDGMTHQKQIELAEAELELAEVNIDLVGVRMNMEILARERATPIPRKRAKAIEREIHDGIDRLRSRLGRV